jgi:hypothetical protein
MAGTKVTHEQFEVLEDRIVHIPTGARIDFYPQRPENFRPSTGAGLASFSKTATTTAQWTSRHGGAAFTSGKSGSYARHLGRA